MKNKAISSVIEILWRYLIALMVGLAFSYLDHILLHRFMNHLGMMGSTISLNLGMLMLLEVPVWAALVWIVSRWKSGLTVELTCAMLVSFCVVQLQGVLIYWDFVGLTTVTPESKAVLLYWYVLTVTNMLLATITAMLWSTWKYRHSLQIL